ncbi:ubiquitin carboxyl-terminal hydrolase 9-like isoform X1 [Phoenix dactylifera]|uniref:Ubiquitin carboxyl-terminal hydrolase n=1 Tax=Phoenix dactylifera TaxID=42345 RepID=A0A8B7CJS3_PHODC|nr:ubiquitin carboxyl-terminal hydrolase 9-like isoform X1 [Phoenix dactylifera]
MTIPNSENFLSGGSSVPCTPEEEKEIVLELTRAAEANQKEGDLYYVVSQRWWRDWQEYVGFDRFREHSSKGHLSILSRPGRIDNSKLVLNRTDTEGNELDLQRHLQEGEDYTLVPHEVWKKLLEWYKGGPELPRKVISEGVIVKELRVEVYPLCLKIIDARDDSQRTIRISRKASVGELYKIVCALLELEQSKARIWDYYEKSKNYILTNFDQTLEDPQLQVDQEILLEVQRDGIWPSNFNTNPTGNEYALVPLEPSRSSITIAGGPTLSNNNSTGFGTHLLQGNSFSLPLRDADGDGILNNGSKVDGRGLTGLHNLGNTCFMNSAIQCLVHTPPVVEYFLKDYSDEINEENPLGMQGELAIAFGELLRKLWSSGWTSIAPRAFKAKLARFAPQFSGYNQHDSQELLAFLLDGLHEDLNRVRKKPYIEARDADGCPDQEFADECWKNHKARNDSVIVDVCQGQYKSTLVCPVCSKVSVTFDPFMYLSLPLPSTVTRMMTVTIFSGDGSSLPMPFTVTLPKNGCCKDLIRALSTSCCLKSSEALLLAEVYDHRIYRYLENPFESLSSIKDEEHIVAYRVPITHDKLLRLEIMHRRTNKFLSEPQFNVLRKLIGTPLVTYISKDSVTGANIHAAVSAVLAPLLRAKAFPPMNQVKFSKENGGGPSLDSIVLTDDGTCSSDKDISTSNMELEERANGLPSLQLALTDEKGVSRTFIDTDCSVFPVSCIRVLMDWSDREHELYDFSFLEDLPEVFKSGFMLKKTRQEAVTLFSCLETFLKEEPLGPDDMWYCPSCKEHRQATKKLDLWRLPKILVVHLKRFSYSRFLKNKLDTFVNFPVHNLDLSKYVKHRAVGPHSYVYELYAISNHYGGLGGGHYSAYATLIEEDSWYHFADSHVSPVNEDEIKTSAAYVLFYRRVKDDSKMSVEETSSSTNSTSC